MEDFRGLFINLDRSEHRRRRFESARDRLGLAANYARFPATDGRSLKLPPNLPANIHPGAIGCFHSHIAAMEQARSLGGLVHIVEDDVVLSRHVAPFLRALPSRRIFEHFDILFLDMWVDPGPQPLGALAAAYRNAHPGGELDLGRVAIVDMRPLRLGAMASYVVNPAALPRLIAELGRRLPFPPAPVDATLGELVRAGTFRAALTIPFLTATDPDNGSRSLIQSSVDEDYMLQVALLRNFLFADRDIDGEILPGLRALAKKRPEPLYQGAVRAIEALSKG